MKPRDFRVKYDVRIIENFAETEAEFDPRCANCPYYKQVGNANKTGRCLHPELSESLYVRAKMTCNAHPLAVQVNPGLVEVMKREAVTL